MFTWDIQKFLKQTEEIKESEIDKMLQPMEGDIDGKPFKSFNIKNINSTPNSLLLTTGNDD